VDASGVPAGVNSFSARQDCRCSDGSSSRACSVFLAALDPWVTSLAAAVAGILCTRAWHGAAEDTAPAPMVSTMTHGSCAQQALAQALLMSREHTHANHMRP
jgi:hypothetical protein